MNLLSDIKIKVGPEKDCVQTVSVEWSASKVKEKIEEAFSGLKNRVKMPGFRPGKTPLEVIKQNFKESAYAEAQDVLLREGVSQAISKENLSPVQPPVVQSIQFEPEKAFQFEFRVEVAPRVKVTGYKGLKLNRKKEVVDDEKVERTIKNLAEVSSKLVESKAEVLEKTHFAVINFEGFMDGKPIANAKTENYLLDMSSPQLISGISEGILGAKPGEEREITVNFPADSPLKDLAGKPGLFKVKLLAIKEKVVPNIDDNLAKDMGLETLSQLKEKVHQNLEKEREAAGKRDMENQIVDLLLSANQFAIPATLLEKQVHYLEHREKDRLTRQGVPEGEQKKVLENMAADLKTRANNQVRLQFILEAIGRAEKIQVSDDEISSKINKMLAESGSKDREGMEKSLRENYLDSIKSDITDEKVFDWIAANAKIKDVAEVSK